MTHHGSTHSESTPSSAEADGSREWVAQAQAGDSDAFAQLVETHRREIASFFYRLTGSRDDAEDLSQDLWTRVFQKLGEFRGASSFRTWLFVIATRLAMDHHRAQQRWPVDAQDRARQLAESGPETAEELRRVQRESVQARYEMTEHIDFCLTCIMKTLPLEQHVAIMLCDIYRFTVAEASEVLDRTLGVVKHLLLEARESLDRIFEHRCALINKHGICHQCSELNGFFNPQQQQREALLKLELVQAAESPRRADLLTLRTTLVQQIDPLHSDGTNLQEAIMSLVRRAV